MRLRYVLTSLLFYVYDHHRIKHPHALAGSRHGWRNYTIVYILTVRCISFSNDSLHRQKLNMRISSWWEAITTVIGVRGRHTFRIRLFALYHEKVNKGELWRVSCGRITSYSQICALVGFSSKSSINGWDGYFFVFSASSQVVLRPNRLEVKTKSLSLLDSIEGYICSYILCCLYLAKNVDGTLLKSCNFCNSKPMIHFISYW